MKEIEVATFDNPPPDDQPFCAFTNKQRLMMVSTKDKLEQLKSKLDDDEEFVGWKKLHIDNKVNPFGFIPPPKPNS